MTYLTPAERLLQELGITEPNEIDLEAIAFHLGARVRFRKLDGCEARIIGRNDAAIRVVEGGHSPALVVCHGSAGRKWFARGPDVPSRWFPKDDLDADSFAPGVRSDMKLDTLLERTGSKSLNQLLKKR